MVFRILGKILSIADILITLIILFSQALPQNIVMKGAFYMMIKGGFFFFLGKDFVSLFDVAIGLYMILLMFGISFTLLNIVAILFLGQKALMGFL